MKQSIALFGGSFNPVHFGHLSLAIEMMEKCQLDQVWFCPAKISPHKLDQKIVDPKHRLKMLNLAIADIPGFSVIENELNREGPSYTIDTLQELFLDEKKKLLPGQLQLIIGEDSVKGFSSWHKAIEIVELVPLLIGKRSLCSNENFFNEMIEGSELLQIHKALLKGIIETKNFDISSTDVRKRLAQGKYCGHLVPLKVLDYISEHRLYCQRSDL